MTNTKSSLQPPFNESQSTGFQLILDQTIQMNTKDNTKERISAWPQKLTSVMDIHRQRFSQLHQKFQPKPVVDPPIPRPQARSKLDIHPHVPSTQRPNTTHHQNHPPSSYKSRNHEYITLANLSKVLGVVQTHEKSTDNSDTITNASVSTSASTKQRVKQHLQQTAIRWWRPIKSSDTHLTSTTIYTSEISNGSRQYFDENILLQRNLPLLTVVSDSTPKLNILSRNLYGNCKYDESEVSTDTSETTVFKSLVAPPKLPNFQCNRQEPLIMQARGMHFHPYNHRHYNHHNNMNFFQQQRFIRQT